ncbi:Galactose-specific lectin nattectin, partial [Pseudolycoriella hygida]
GCQAVNGDPAPGRSPGPPSPHTGNADSKHAYNNLSFDQMIQENGTFEFNENGEHANSSELSNTQQNEEKIIKTSNKIKTFINQINNSKFNNQRKNSENLRSESDKNKYCKSVDIYVGGEEKIVKIDRGNDEEVSVPIKFDVIHDLFDTQRGLLSGLMYTVQLRMETPDAINNFFIESFLNDEPSGQFIELENYLSQNKWNHAEDENVNKMEAVSKDFMFGEDDWSRSKSTGNNEVYTENDNQCKKNIWTENSIASNRLQMKWYFNDPLKVNLKNKTVKFRILYRKISSSVVFEIVYIQQVLEECILSLVHPSATLDYTTMPIVSYNNCSVFFPSRDMQSAEPAGLLVHLTRLNVPCINGGYVSIGENNFLCGKLEDLSLSERTYYFSYHQNTSVALNNHPMFSLNYKLVDYCYNITLTEQNSSYYMQPKASLECYFKIHLPYGNRVELNLITNLRNASDIYLRNSYESSGEFVEPEFLDLSIPQSDTGKMKHCHGILVQLDDMKQKPWMHCVNAYSATRKFNIISSGNVLVIKVMKTASHQLSETVQGPSLYFEYVALPIPHIVSQCAFGWVAVQQNCITAIESPMSWHYAEIECKKIGGHLASVQSEREQRVIDHLLLNSSGYKDVSAYWVGATDKNFEGDFRWTNGFPFTYANWFPGWSEHNNYNKQPNDDGLSGQDCVELRRSFRAPPGIHAKNKIPLSSTFMWNDRDCSAKNSFLCERPMSDEPLLRAEWATGCNKTVILTKDNPRLSLWSPGFPRQYPDNINCFTVVIAPNGFNIVLEFEELVLENEPECSYDFLEIIDGKDESPNRISVKDFYRKYLHRHRRNSAKNPFLYPQYNDVYSTQSLNSLNQDANNISVNFFEKFLNIYKSHATVVLQTPKLNVNSDQFLFAKSVPHRICGDWSSKLKLLRYASTSTMLGLHFRSDYSHHFSGYKAKVSIKNASSECVDERLNPYNGSCYLFVTYPEVDWQTAQQVCRGMGAQLTSISSADEQRFISANIRNQMDYTPQAIYWLGGELSQNKEFEWTDGSAMTFQGWLPGQGIIEKLPKEHHCLGLQWKKSPTPMLPSGIYWASQKCSKFGGYICKKKKQREGETYVQNKTISGTEGRMTSPGYPNTYPLNIDYWIKIYSPQNTRIIIQFQTIDLEQQDECLYDYISIEDAPPEQFESISMAMLRVEDHFNYQMDEGTATKTDIWLTNNDTSIVKRDLKYFRNIQRLLRAENDLRNEMRQLEAIKNKLQMSNRPKRAVTVNSHVHYALHNNSPSFLPYVRWCGLHNTNMSKYDFVSTKNGTILHFHSDYSLSGIGYSFTWNAVDISGCPSQTLTSKEGIFSSPNYPHFLLNNLDCSFIIQAPNGRRVWLRFIDFQTIDDSLVDVDLGGGATVTPFKDAKRLNDGIFVSSKEKLIVRIRTGPMPRGRGFRALFKTMNTIAEHHTLNLTEYSYGSLQHLNYPQSLPININFTQHLVAPIGNVVLLEVFGVGFSENECRGGGGLEIFDNYADNNGTYWHLCEVPNRSNLNLLDESAEIESLIRPSPIHITSYLNTLHIREITHNGSIVRLNATVRTQTDMNYKFKLASTDDSVETCNPNPCQFGGKCISAGNMKRFCGLNMCEIEPCIYGKCELTSTSYKCQCQQGYEGRTCDQKQKPCASNPCEGRGECFDKNGSFFCRCHAWWEGSRCEKRMVRIPYKPLSERMLQEPFWLGLITVFVVLAVIGLVWCAKRHFPEKIEKLLAEEAERNRRTPSPRKKRNNSTPTKKNAAEKKQILQQLISPAANQSRPKVSLDDLIHMSENRLKPISIDSESDVKETTFSENSVTAANKGQLNDAKMEKKVTFARLLSKVSAEISSGSEGTHKESGLSLAVELPIRASSVPPSPCTNDIRSPHSTSSNQGSDSLSSSELMLPDIDIRSCNKRLRSKVSSADSILAMFRNFASTTVSSQMPTSMVISPTSSPSVSTSPQDDQGDDESSTSSMHTPCSFTSGPNDSPVFYRQNTIEVPVLDILSSQQSVNGSSSNYLNPPSILLEIPSNINKCLSPIREMPTPMPSPCLTPVMNRPHRFTRFQNTRHQNVSASFSDDDEKITVEQYETQSKDTTNDTSQSSGGFLTETGLPNINSRPTQMLQVHPPSVQISIDIAPPTPEERSSNRPTQLIIPELVVQQASPTKERLPLHPGSPPPQQHCNSENPFSVPTTSKLRRQLKQSDHKPASLDLPFIPPMITITTNMSEVESDADISPTMGLGKPGSHLVVPTTGMCYLSPFSICTRGDRTISESNLSSSGYSSMASPGPSRCGSSNPLCSSEMDAAGTGNTKCNLFQNAYPNLTFKGSSGQLALSTLSIRSRTALKSCQKGSKGSTIATNEFDHRQRLNSRSDSETLSDEVLLESNDEGIGTDHLDEKIEDGEIKSAKELEIYIGKELIDNGKNIPEETICMAQLQLPLIVIQSDGGVEKGLSPVSSRSESPLSERTTSIGRFSPLFYGKKDQQLPFTDSDGLYDFPSSDGKNYSTTYHSKKSSMKRKERKSSRAGLSQSPTKSSSQLEIPMKESHSPRHSHHSSKHHHHSPVPTARKSPKRRTLQRYPVASSSSSSESLVPPRSQMNIFTVQVADESNSETNLDRDKNERIPKSYLDEKSRPKKLSRLRAIGNQIRFLRRLEKSIKKREEIHSPTDSCHDYGSDEHDSPGVMSPLLRSPVKSNLLVKTGRQKRLNNLYSGNIPWRSRERHYAQGDINSD